MNYNKTSTVLKALAEPNRLKIVNLLSCGTLCACDILSHFDFTQPALSHHMKVLEEADIVIVEKKGTWNHYKLNKTFIINFQTVCKELFSSDKSTCTCNTKN
ncbi:ArsR/SmtB family transcription factor [Lactovum miscens]|uniref:ArsR family transcriptional regulator n=1 Tax=Lactovum miscens TaxID=190387 RepID=A0A841C767_9LACT|nr:metalloregulator ArsR/SmtB family transcription factor [Lactovum miscens]MBB5887578.1 ArsR family transcriptional regulator [Lactovum miscens]